MPTFYMCSLKLHVEIIEQIDNYLKQCLWNGGDLTKNGGCLVAWKTACRRKEEGAMCIINLRASPSVPLS